MNKYDKKIVKSIEKLRYVTLAVYQNNIALMLQG